MRMRMAAHPCGPAPLLDFRPRERASAVSPSHAVRPRADPGRGSRQGLRGPRDRRGVRGRRQGAAARTVAQQPAVGGREPAPVRVLARAADAEGRERLRSLRPAAARDGLPRVAVRRGAATGLIVLALALTGCGGGDDPTGDSTTPTPTPAPPPRTATAATTPATPTPGSSPYSTTPQSPGESGGGSDDSGGD